MPFSFRSLAAGLLTAALLVGCGSSAVVSEPEPTTVYPGAPGTISRTEASQAAPMAARSAYVEADVRFMQDMIHHHTQALEMAALVPERTTREDIRRLAQRIEVSQYDEIELMRRWLTDRGEVAVEAHGGHGHTSPAERPPDHPPEHDAHHDHHQHHHAAPAVDPHAGMPGMLSSAQMARMAEASGEAFDRLFLEGMIFHHEGALVMVEELLAHEGAAQDTEIFQFASHVDADQRIEIARMRRMLAELPHHHHE
jgi:uncharacterized protein (DUF305 family)